MKIQQIAPGLLALLGLKTMGNNPGEFGETIAPTLDLRQWLLYSKRQLLNGYLAIPATPGVNSSLCDLLTTGALATPVPENEVWYVHQVSGRVRILDASDSMIGSYGVSLEMPGTHYQFLAAAPPVGSSIPYQPMVGSSADFAFMAKPERWISGGTKWGIHIGQWDFSVAGADMEVYAEVSRLEV